MAFVINTSNAPPVDPANHSLYLVKGTGSDEVVLYFKGKEGEALRHTLTKEQVQVLIDNSNPDTIGIVVKEETSFEASVNMHYVVVSLTTCSIQFPSNPQPNAKVFITVANGLKNNTVLRNGKKIMGLDEDIVLDLGPVTYQFKYLDELRGWFL